MAKVESTQTLAQALHDEHDRLGRSVIKLREQLVDDLNWNTLDRVLMELDDCIGKHFEFEEHGGYMKEVVRRLPSAQAKVDLLIEQHTDLSEQLRNARHLVVDRADPQVIIAHLAEWIGLLTKHEEIENWLTQEAFNADTGGGD